MGLFGNPPGVGLDMIVCCCESMFEFETRLMNMYMVVLSARHLRASTAQVTNGIMGWNGIMGRNGMLGRMVMVIIMNTPMTCIRRHRVVLLAVLVT